MFNGVMSWLSRPFDPAMSAWRWFLFLGLLMVLLAIWAMVTGILKDAAS